jgi:hypothetical protein
MVRILFVYLCHLTFYQGLGMLFFYVSPIRSGGIGVTDLRDYGGFASQQRRA